MRVLIVKLSSLGDVIHTLPAITECLKNFPQIKIDWVVEPAFKDVLQWHPGIKNIYLFPLRAARKKPILLIMTLLKVLKTLRSNHYDLVIDAQGLIKSAILAKSLKTKRLVGLDKASCREPFASKFYDKGYFVPWSNHAVMRLKHLFSQIFGYPLSSEIHYGLSLNKITKPLILLETVQNNYIVFLHGTTWESKHWPEKYWEALIRLITIQNPSIKILLPWGSDAELARANRLAQVSAQVEVLPKLSIPELAYYLSKAQSIVAVDTGLGHLAAALGIKTINLYGPTDPNRTGTIGLNQVHLAASHETAGYPCSPCLKRKCMHIKPTVQDTPPCYQGVNPETVMKQLVL